MEDRRTPFGSRWAPEQILSVFLGSKKISTMFRFVPCKKHISRISQRHFVRSRLKGAQLGLPESGWFLNTPPVPFSQPYSHHHHSHLGSIFTVLLPSTHLSQALIKVTWYRKSWMSLQFTPLMLICVWCWIKMEAKPRLLSHRSIYLPFNKLTWLHIFHT